MHQIHQRKTWKKNDLRKFPMDLLSSDNLYTGFKFQFSYSFFEEFEYKVEIWSLYTVCHRDILKFVVFYFFILFVFAMIPHDFFSGIVCQSLSNEGTQLVQSSSKLYAVFTMPTELRLLALGLNHCMELVLMYLLEDWSIWTFLKNLFDLNFKWIRWIYWY